MFECPESEAFPHHRKWLQNSLAPELDHPSSDAVAPSLVTSDPMVAVFQKRTRLPISELGLLAKHLLKLNL